jgi:hypothetical protein
MHQAIGPEGIHTMKSIIQSALTGIVFTAAVILSGGLVFLLGLTWQALNDPFFDA